MRTTVEAKWREFEREVEDLTPLKRRGFATFVASRAARYYLEYCTNHACSDPILTSEFLGLAWRALEAGTTQEDLAPFRKRLQTVAEELGRSDDSSGIAAQEACFACTVLCEILAGENDAKQTMRVVDFLKDIADMIVQDRADLDANSEHLETNILSHPLMAEELRRIRGALDIASRVTGTEFVAQLRELA